MATMLIESEREGARAVSGRVPVRVPELVPDEAARASEFGLTAAFWERFHARYWEKQPVVVRRALGRALATPDETFGALVRAGERHRAGERGAALEFCIERANLMADVGRHLPGPDDASIDAYVGRVTRLIGGRRFGLVVDELQEDDPTLWLRLRELVRGLYGVTGWPGEQAKASVFLGNYRQTPYGVHRGRAGELLFIVSGRKRILVWPPDYFDGKEDMTYRTDYERYRDDAIVLEGGPGDLLYWPSNHWHIGEDVDGGFSMAVCLMLFMEPSLTPDLLGEARRLAEARIGPAHEAAEVALGPGRPPGARAIVTAVARATAALRRASRDPELERRLLAARLNQATGFGFTAVPAPLPAAALAADDVVRGWREYPVLWRVVRGELVCSASGRAFVLAAHPRLVRLLRWVNSGRPRSVARLVADHAGPARVGTATVEASADDVRALLDKLRSLRAVEVVTAPARA